MNYSVINDEQKMKEFIDWLPQTSKSEQYYLCLFARSKYCKDITHIKSDKSQLKRFTSTKDRMFDKIRQLECRVGSYKQYKEKEEDIPIPQEALALYITPNPRDLWKATFNTVIHLTKCIRDSNVNINPQAEAMSEIQKAKGATRMVDFDLDSAVYSDIITDLELIYKCVNKEAVTLVRTRGGIHVLVDPSLVEKEHRNIWYQGISQMSTVDQTGDMMIPVVGSYQGGFTPHFTTLEQIKNSYENLPIESIPG